MLCCHRAGCVYTKLVYRSHRSTSVFVGKLGLSPALSKRVGSGHLLNHLRNARRKRLLAEIVDLVDPKSVADAINVVTVDDCHSVAVLLGSVSNERSKAWGQTVSRSIDRDHLFALAGNWLDRAVFTRSPSCVNRLSGMTKVWHWILSNTRLNRLRRRLSKTQLKRSPT